MTAEPTQPAAAVQVPVAREGWQMVPVMPTHDMLSAMAECDGYLPGDRERPGLNRWEDYWLKAVNAAPALQLATLTNERIAQLYLGADYAPEAEIPVWAYAFARKIEAAALASAPPPPEGAPVVQQLAYFGRLHEQAMRATEASAEQRIAELEAALAAAGAPVARELPPLPEPAGKLHDDGLYTSKNLPYEAQFAGWRAPYFLAEQMHEYARAALSESAEAKLAAGAPVAQAAWLDVLAERRRQIEVEGWTLEHDDSHASGQLAVAAACYADPRSRRSNDPRIKTPHGWPWVAAAWKPRDRRSDLVRAGALILAEIERRDRERTEMVSKGPREVCARCDTPNACREEGCRNV